MLRLTLMATHTAEQLRLAGEIIAESVELARAAADRTAPALPARRAIA